MLRRKLPPLNALRAFEVAGRRLNFRAAADELGVTQGAVAQQVRALEDHIGTALFLRQARGLALTPKGALYLADVTRAFETLSEATGRLLERPAMVTVSTTPTFASRLLIPRLADLQAVLPGVELRTIATEAVSDFERDEVDIAVRLARGPFASSLEAELLFHQDIIAVASPHLVKSSGLPLSLEALQGLPMLHDAHDLWQRFLPPKSVRPGPKFNQTTLALDAALAGQGIALACQAFVQGDLDAGRLVRAAQKSMRVEASYYLVRRRSAIHSLQAETVWQWFLSTWRE